MLAESLLDEQYPGQAAQQERNVSSRPLCLVESVVSLPLPLQYK